MTQDQVSEIDKCPECGEPVMKVPSTGLVSCMASLKFLPCKWYVRTKPFKQEHERKRAQTRKEADLQKQQDIINKLIEEHGSN